MKDWAELVVYSVVRCNFLGWGVRARRKENKGMTHEGCLRRGEVARAQTH